MSVVAKGRVRSESGLNLREKPNGNKINVLAPDAQVEILQEVKFLRVKTSDGQIGYVHSDYIDESPALNEVQASGEIDDVFPDPEFKLVKFTGDCFIGQPAMVDVDFALCLKRVNTYAKQCDVKIWVTSATRNINQQVNGAIVKPASKSCHHIGHAIDMNIMHGGTLYNSKALIKSNFKNLPDNVTGFIKMLRDDEQLRWGGDFNTQDPVHIDDNFYYRQQLMYVAKLQSRMNQLNA